MHETDLQDNLLNAIQSALDARDEVEGDDDDIALAESGRAAEVAITGDVIRAYKRNFERHQGALVKACSARSITHVLVPTTTGADELILKSLWSRRLVG